MNCSLQEFSHYHKEPQYKLMTIRCCINTNKLYYQKMEADLFAAM